MNDLPADDHINNSRPILVSGASIAGLTLAYWLNHHGFKVVVIEKASELRLGGQNIDVKGPAWEIAQKMGIAEKIRAADTTEIGIRFVNTDDKVLAEFPKGHPMSMTQELEILRGDLVKILYDLVSSKVKFQFGDHIKAVREQDDHTDVEFASGKVAKFGLVLIAEGIGSSTRKLVFKNEPQFNYLGLYTAYLTIAKTETDTKWARWCNAPGGIVFLLRPDPYGTTRACVNLRAEEDTYNGFTIQAQKEVLIKAISDVGWEAPRLARAINNTEDLYFERISQVEAPHWSKGRVAMTGDAAYCVTPIAGKGTDLAMLGPYILAGELASTSTYASAFKIYQDKLKSYVKKVQNLPPGVPGLVYPTSKVGVNILNTFFRAFGSQLVKKLATKLAGKNKKVESEFKLPDYSRTLGIRKTCGAFGIRRSL